MLRFECDYTEGCIPEILQAIERENHTQLPGYSEDPICTRAKAKVKALCGTEDVDVHFLVGGTQANTTIIADVSDLTDEHTAGAGNGVLLLAALGDDAHDHFADLLLITAADLRDLGEGCGVNVEGDDVADDLVGVTLGHIVVDLPCCLSEYALGLDDPVSTVFVSFKLFHKLNLLMI